MSNFKWTDRFGVERRLKAPMAIEEEAREISAEIDAAFDKSKNAPPDAIAGYREQIRNLMGRLNSLRSDADRWNASALEEAKALAGERVKEIRTFVEGTLDIVIVARLHEVRMETFNSEDDRASALASPATDAQRSAIACSNREPKPSGVLTRAEADDWLERDPSFWRPITDEGGWFPWVDADGTTQRLSSPLQIEIELAKLIGNLGDEMPILSQSKSLNEISRSLEETNCIFTRISILQSDLERFSQDQISKEESEWKECEQQWKQSRGRQA